METIPKNFTLIWRKGPWLHDATVNVWAEQFAGMKSLLWRQAMQTGLQGKLEFWSGYLARFDLKNADGKMTAFRGNIASVVDNETQKAYLRNTAINLNQSRLLTKR